MAKQKAAKKESIFHIDKQELVWIIVILVAYISYKSYRKANFIPKSVDDCLRYEEDKEFISCLELVEADEEINKVERASAYEEHGLTLFQSKKKQPARVEALLSAGLALDPRNYYIRIGLSNLYKELKRDTKDRLRVIEEGVSLVASDEDSIQLQLELAKVLMDDKQYRRAILLMQDLLEQKHTDENIRDLVNKAFGTWQKIPVAQGDMYYAPIFEGPFDANNKKVFNVPFASLTGPLLTGRVDPNYSINPRKFTATLLSPHPRIVHIEKFITPEEADEISKLQKEVMSRKPLEPIWCFDKLEHMQKMMETATGNAQYVVVNEEDKMTDLRPVEPTTFCLKDYKSAEVSKYLKYSTAASIFESDSPLVANMTTYIEKTLGFPSQHAANWMVTSYDYGEEYTNHTDCLMNRKNNNSPISDRIATLLIYLTDVEEGGRTIFSKLRNSTHPASPFHVAPRKGDAVVFRNLNEKGDCIGDTLHYAEIVKKGHKVIAQRWYHRSASNGLNFPHEAPMLKEYRSGQAVIKCNGPFKCRRYNQWTAY